MALHSLAVKTQAVVLTSELTLFRTRLLYTRLTSDAPRGPPLTKQGLDSEQHLHSYSNKQGLTLILASCLSPACFQGNVSEETRAVLTASTGPVPLLCPSSADFCSRDARSHDNQVEDSPRAHERGELREFRRDQKKMRTGNERVRDG